MTPSRTPLWRCPACAFRTHDVDAALAHAALPPSQYLGAHEMFARPTLAHPAHSFEDLRVAAGAAGAGGRPPTEAAADA